MEQRHLAMVPTMDTVAPMPRHEPDQQPVPAPVRAAISTMYARYAEPITLTDLAAKVFVSPFHFSRVFTKAVGVTPGRYLTGIRLFEAKRLLLETNLTVSDVVCAVGYSSVGTFTFRFTQSVGMTPSQFRDPEVREQLLVLSPRFQRLPSVSQPYRPDGYRCQGPGLGRITARVELPPGLPAADLLVGVFSDVIPQCRPVAFTSQVGVQSTIDVEIAGVPDGRWMVLAVAEHTAASRAVDVTVGRALCLVGSRVDVPTRVRLRMRAGLPTDPPIAVSFADIPALTGRRAGSRHLRTIA